VIGKLKPFSLVLCEKHVQRAAPTFLRKTARQLRSSVVVSGFIFFLA
jgi:hypothetical protein